jgi:hypothetical protein
MHAQVASQYSNVQATPKSGAYGNVFLVGDAAHRFPPSGGFGMNTGLQDAHNLAWKLAMVTQCGSVPSLLNTYETGNTLLVVLLLCLSLSTFMLLYVVERRPVAVDITELSKRNYGLTAGLARVLGVDPDLAAAAVSASNSSVSSFVPFSVRRAGVLKALQTALYSLKWLKDWRTNVLGGLRVRALQHLIDTGKSLPLIFPEQDLGTVYRAGALVKAENSGQQTKPFRGVQLRVGCRIPHCWLTPCTLPSTGAMSSELAFSTVHLPVLLEQLHALKHPGAPGAAAGPVLIVHAKWEAAAVRAVSAMNSSNMQTIQVVSVKSADTPLTPGTLQRKYQNPHYAVPACASPEIKESNTLTERFAAVFRGELTLDYTENSGSVDVLRVEDLEGRWRDLCKPQADAWQAARRGPNSESVSPKDVAVVLRPDGHVASVFNAGRYQHSDMLPDIYDAAVALSMSRADGLNF